MLNIKLNQMRNLEPLWKLRDAEKIADAISKIISLMKDLLKLCKKHKIEAKLYNGDTIEKIYKLMGDVRVTRWLTKICDVEVDDEDLWERLVQFLEKDLRIQQQMVLVYRKSDQDKCEGI